jgi:hypothetical protein
LEGGISWWLCGERGKGRKQSIVEKKEGKKRGERKKRGRKRRGNKNKKERKGKKKKNALIDGLDQLGPVLDASGHVPTEDPVVLARLDPGVLDVVDLELDIGRHESGLVGREVVADDLGVCKPQLA